MVEVLAEVSLFGVCADAFWVWFVARVSSRISSVSVGQR